MTDRYIALTVTLETTIREDDAEPIIQAIEMIKGVRSVCPVVADAQTHWAKENARQELIANVLHFLDNPQP